VTYPMFGIICRRKVILFQSKSSDANIAEMGNGPTHIGEAVTLEGEADFDQVVIVYYPGVEYFAEMIQSEFFAGIVGGKQDTLSSPTVPSLPHLYLSRLGYGVLWIAGSSFWRILWLADFR